MKKVLPRDKMEKMGKPESKEPVLQIQDQVSENRSL